MAPDFGFFQVERQTVERAAIRSGWKLDHFVEHHIAQAFDLGHASPISRTTPMLDFVTAVFSPAISDSMSWRMLLMTGFVE